MLPRRWRILLILIVILTVIYFFSRSSSHTFILENFLDPADYRRILADFHQRMQTSATIEELPNVKRENMFVPHDSVIYSILNQPKYIKQLHSLLQNSRVYLARNHPVEYRKYTPGSFMARHRDTQLFTVPQYECILTLSNTTDSETIFYTTDGPVAIHAPANSLMFVRANGVQHEVTPVSTGERCFIKFIMTETDKLINE